MYRKNLAIMPFGFFFLFGNLLIEAFNSFNANVADWRLTTDIMFGSSMCATLVCNKVVANKRDYLHRRPV